MTGSGNNEPCLVCGDTGTTATGAICSCGRGFRVQLPMLMEIPPQYQGVEFNRDFLPTHLQLDYGSFVQGMVNDVKKGIPLLSNVLICAPPNSGKTVFAYTCYGLLYARGVAIPKLMDLLEARAKLQALYDVDIEAVELISNSPLAFFKIPMDVPNRFGEIMSSIMERRVRAGGTTVFLYSGEVRDLKALDRFNRFTALIGDGNYNSLLVKSYHVPQPKNTEEK